MKKAVLMTLLFFSLFIFVGCNINESSIIVNDKTSTGLNKTEPNSPIWLSLTSEKSIIKLDENLIIRLYYGTTLNYPDDFLCQFEKNGLSPDDIYTELVISYGKYYREIIQNDENIYSNSEYKLESIKTGEIIYKNIEKFGAELYPMLGYDSQNEIINLSSDLFSEKYGFVCCSIRIFPVYSDEIDKDNGTGNGITLYYIIDDDSVLLYDNFYAFNSDFTK